MNDNKRLPALKLAALVELSKNLGIDYDAFKNMVQSKTDVSLIIPELADLKHYDILTIHWKSQNQKCTNKSLPIPIKEDMAGKEFVYQIPINKSFTIDVGNVDIWYTVQQCGSDEIRHSVITQSIVSHPLVSKLLPQLESVVNSFELNAPDFQKKDAVDLSRTADDEIVYAKIHPAIGTGRVGNSTTDYYIAPEYANQPPPEFGETRDASGAIKREAAKFRIYGYNKNGVAVAELTADNANITWTVEVANKKASWYYFDEALDMPGASPVGRRNPLIRGEARKQLEMSATLI